MSWNCGEFVFEAVEYVGLLAGFFRAHFEVEFYPHFNLHKHDKQKGERRGTTHDKVMPSLALDRSCLLCSLSSLPLFLSFLLGRGRGGASSNYVTVAVPPLSLPPSAQKRVRGRCRSESPQDAINRRNHSHSLPRSVHEVLQQSMI